MESNDVSLKEHLEEKIESLKELLITKLDSNRSIQEKINELNNLAIEKSETSVTIRLGHINNKNEEIDGIIETLLPILEFKAYKESQISEHENIKDRLNKIETNQKVVEGKASMPMFYVVAIVTVIGLVLSILNLIDKF